MRNSTSDRSAYSGPSETDVTGRLLDGRPENAFLIGIDGIQGVDDWPGIESLGELARLVSTAGATVVGQTLLRIRRPTPATLIGSGQLREAIAKARSLKAELLAVDAELHPRQQRNIENAFKGKVLDRTAIILDIFASRANTAEGRLQVERAQLEYLLPRLSELWVQFSRQRGGIGPFRGPGETQIETDRRLYRERIATLDRRIDEVRARRASRRSRRERTGLLTAALVGYTNAGKSSLLNALTGSNARVENRLFATLDPITRAVALPGGGSMLLTDTVGFIQRLPTRLVKAFRGTLEEALAADVVIHVVDLANKNYNRQISVVEETLLEIGAGRRPMVTALNKCDAAGIPDLHEFPNAVATSSITGDGLKELLNRLDEIERDRSLDIEVELPYNAGNLAALFHDRGHVAFESFGPNGTRLKGKIPSALVDRFGPYRI